LATMDSQVLQLSDVKKSFSGIQVLHGVNFSLRKGEIHALVGENGAGKSTLMNIIMGIHQPDSGEIRVNGSKVVVDSPLAALSLGIGIVPQELNLVPKATVAENIFLGMERKRGRFSINWRSMYQDAGKLLAQIGVGIDVRTKAEELSAAYQQLVQIARALAFGAQILILDEPTASLTFNEAERLFDILEQLKREGKSIIYISHRMEEIRRLSDRVSVMRDGNMIDTLNKGEFTTEDLICLMAGRELSESLFARNKTPSEKELLKVSNLSRKNEFTDISFSLYEGEILGIAGLVGSGRTELANCIFGVTTPDEGSIWWEGKAVNIQSPTDAIKLGIGYVPEERRKNGIFAIRSVGDNITMPILRSLTKWSGINKNKEIEVIHQYIAKLKIKTSSPEQFIGYLSGGNQQKAILARWLAKGVKMLILDEPTRGIDVHAKHEIHELIKSLADAGMSVLIISSELEEVIHLSDRIMVMHEGRMKGIFDSSQVAQETLLQAALT